MPLAPLITAADLPDDADAGMAAEAASAVVRSYCGWHIAPSITETWTVDTDGSALLALPTLRLSSVTSVTLDGTLLASTEYSWSERGLLRREGGWGTAYRSAVVVATHGHAETPRDVVVAAVAAARRQLHNPDNDRSEQGPGYSVVYTIPGTGEAYGVMLSKVEQTILDRYAIPWVPA